MSRYPFDPPYDLGRRTDGKPVRGGTLNQQNFGKGFDSQRVRPACVDHACWRTARIPALSYSGSQGDGSIVWADSADHNKTFDIDLRDGSLRYVQPVIDSISWTIAPGGPTPIITAGILAYFLMYYKDGSEINYSVLMTSGNLFFSSGALVHQNLASIGTQSWEAPGSEAASLRPSGFAIRVLANSASSVSFSISDLFIASLNQ